MIQSYKKNPALATNYDSIIVGSGMGSLTTAAILAKEGQKVLVLEKHYTAGGFTHVFKRKGFEWDVGIHYIGEVKRPNSVIKKLFDYVSDSKLEWADMGDVYDKIIIGDKEYDFVKGTQNFKAKLTEYFPDEKDAIDNYVNLVFEAIKTSQNFYISKAISPLLNLFIGKKMRKPFYEFSDKTTYEVLKSITDNEELVQAGSEHTQTIFHPVGTCKMGLQDDPTSVVDEGLRVHGLKGIRVVDASIMPTIVSGNTNSPTIMIAEKGADMIMQHD